MRIELYHDILAQKVFEKASAEEKARLKIERFVRERHGYFRENRELLTKKELDYITPYLDKLELEPEYLDFIAASRKDAKRRRERRRATAVSVGAVLLALLALSLMALHQSTIEKERQRALLLATQSKLALDQGKVSQAFRLAQEAFMLNKDTLSRSMAKEVILELYRSGLYCDVAHKGLITALDVSPGGHDILTASSDGVIKIWDADCFVKAEFDQGSRILGASFCPDPGKKLFLSYAADSSLALYDYNSKKKVSWQKQTTAAISDAAFSRDGLFLSYGNKAGEAALYPADKPDEPVVKFQFYSPVAAVDFSSNHYWLVASEDSIMVYSISDSGVVTPLSAFPPEVGRIENARFLIGADHIFIEGERGNVLRNYQGASYWDNIELFRLAQMRDTREIAVQENPSPPHHLMAYSISELKGIRMVYLQHPPASGANFTADLTDSVTHFCFSHDGKELLIAKSNGEFEVRDIKSKHLKYDLNGKIDDAIFLPQPGYLASVEDSTAHLWRLPEGLPEQKIPEIENVTAHYDNSIRKLPIQPK